VVYEFPFFSKDLHLLQLLQGGIPICFFMHMTRFKFWTLKKKGSFALQLATQLVTIFIRCECYWTSFKSCNSLYIQCNSLKLNYNLVVTIPFQLLCNSPMIIIIMSCWCHFSSIHQNLTSGTMMIFCDFFEILISIVHYDYLF